MEETAIDRGADEVCLYERVCLRSRLVRVGGGDGDEDKDWGATDVDEDEVDASEQVVMGGVGEDALDEDLDDEGVEEGDGVLDDDGES